MSHTEPGTSNPRKTVFPRARPPSDSHVSDSDGENSAGDRLENLMDERAFEDGKRTVHVAADDEQVEESEESKYGGSSRKQSPII
jgi:hypothetical protein